MTDETTPFLESPEWAEIQSMLAGREFAEAAKHLEHLLPQVTRPEERAVCYQVLASAYWVRAAEEKLEKHSAVTEFFRTKVRETYEAALFEFPKNTRLRNGMALFLLMDGHDPGASLTYLEPVLGEELAADDEQRRLVLNGIAMALLGLPGQAARMLVEAFGGVYPEVIEQPDLAPLGILIKRRIKLPADAVDELLGRIVQYRSVDQRQIEMLRQGLPAQG